MNKTQFQSETQFNQTDFQQQLIPQYVNIYKHLPAPNPLMEKIQFQQYKINSFFPIKLKKLDIQLRDIAQNSIQTNISKLQDSAFYHLRMKQKIDRLLNAYKQKKQCQGNLFQRYGHLTPYYRKFINTGSKYFATALLDLKGLQISSKVNTQFLLPPTQSIDPYKIQFDSAFQGGNLFHVYQKGFDNFQLILQNDINTRGNNQWFFFRVRNVPKGKVLKFNIMNLVKSDSLFNYGMKPTIFSKARHQKKKIGWMREGQKISYQSNTIKRQHKDKNHYTLSFQYKFIYDNDTVYFSHSYPYTFTDLSIYLKNLCNKKELGKIMSIKKFSRTIGKNDVDLITITNKKISAKLKKVVWIFARQHPGQVSSSFMMEGMMDFLTSNHKTAQYLRDHIVFKIVPMINIDGVIHGNSRCQLVGSDPNRRWKQPNKKNNPVIHHIKKSIQKQKHHSIDMILDLHSHSRKVGTFFYGNTIFNDQTSRLLPLHICKNDEKFSFQNSRFNGGYSTTARSALFKSLKIPKIYTVQSSFYAYQKGKKQLIQYYPNDYKCMGKSILESYACFIYNQVSSSIESFQNISNIYQPQYNKNNNLKQITQELKNKDLIQYGDKQSVGSDSNPSQDQFEQQQLKKILPKKCEFKKKIKIVRHKSKNQKNIERKDQNKYQQPHSSNSQIRKKVSEVLKKNKRFQQKIYNFQKYTSMESRRSEIQTKVHIVTYTKLIQTEAYDQSLIKTFQNKSTSIDSKKQNLCVIGQKMQQKQVWICDKEIGTQTCVPKVIAIKDNKLQNNLRRSIKVGKISNSINYKENNFLIREISLRR